MHCLGLFIWDELVRAVMVREVYCIQSINKLAVQMGLEYKGHPYVRYMPQRMHLECEFE